ncbi:GMC family oxidoreductase [Bradyrhizobium sp. LHD-71]|uniref:GMC family oxidoreductase n=1 Tax=Bradyrhizobium sp. LHD-71 TaxID=3072141 RepID=UPI00280CB0C7|nr:GMC family oxidoreductase [Bradyrhizobium sp. LHD-71]MDQ8727652.1 GMC family oxidoreductase [Bradyrhizobium sp. LHD-71]
MNLVPVNSVSGQHFETIIIGTGFGSSFYLHEARRYGLQPTLVVDWGQFHPHDWQVEQKRNSATAVSDTFNSESSKVWNYTIGFGGGMNCWFAQTPRFHPTDFQLASRYGIGQDWPITYDELEPYYAEAEEIMSISGDPDMARIMPRSRDFPQPPHNLTTADQLMKRAQPDRHFAMPTARARVATSTRSACCASLRCQLCPVDAKFTAQNGFPGLYDDPAVKLCLGTRALHFVTAGDRVTELVVEHEGREYRLHADRFILGANAIQSPAILLNSGMESPLTGAGLHESYGFSVEVFLDGLDHFNGSTITTGINYSLYDGDHRRDTAAALVYFENRWTYGLRREPGKHRWSLPVTIVTEDLLQPENRVLSKAATPQPVPTIAYGDASDYARRGADRALRLLPEVLKPLPVEAIHFRGYRPTESHLQGTLRMGRTPDDSVVDADQIHHRWRNLTVVGTSVFPSCSCANPSLTVAALSLRAARLAVA